MQYTPDLVAKCKEMYSRRKETIDYLEKFGSKFEKAEAMLIKEVSMMTI